MQKRFTDEVRDAVALLDFAVAQGSPLRDELIEKIKHAQNFPLADGTWPEDSARSDFEKAYRDLAQVMKPVTAASLRDTSERCVERKWGSYWKASRAVAFSRQLYWFVAAAALLIVSEKFFPFDEEQIGISTFIRPLMPFVFGLVGALMHLLRSAHTYIATRTFDSGRRPEYYSRMWLGFLSGGVVLIFVKPEAVGAGQNAISFIVGYNTDYLFQTIERLAQAIFPKDAKDSSGVASLSLDKKTLSPGEVGNGTVVLTGPAPEAGVTVALTADAGLTLGITAVKINKGGSIGAFTFKLDATAPRGAKLTLTGKVDGTAASDSIAVA
jgi:hypothetical protein